ncbi:hypothetical protein SAMN04489832_3380 [Micromonospora cremea]|uniref:Uncharacterized protein n=1 Tax=Micromonospora cremea TaxID=709881 RepID=A0A1N5YX24_9ACTN|nr:hypothetical protein SAMN04489832_3380 [Micromonospora cremea]
MWAVVPPQAASVSFPQPAGDGLPGAVPFNCRLAEASHPRLASRG